MYNIKMVNGNIADAEFVMRRGMSKVMSNLNNDYVNNRE
jgi:hypothetical protein